MNATNEADHQKIPIHLVDAIAYPIEDADHYESCLSVEPCHGDKRSGEVCFCINGKRVFSIDLPHWLEICRNSIDKFGK